MTTATAPFIVPLWFALKKAGLAPGLSLIGIVPTLGPIIVLFILAFSTWKVIPAPQYAVGYPMQTPQPPAYRPPPHGLAHRARLDHTRCLRCLSERSLPPWRR